MGNCLVTKLKSVVSNDNLDVLNEMHLKVNSATYASGTYFTLRFDGATKLRSADGSAIFAINTSFETMYNELLNTQRDVYIKPVAGQEIIIEGYYNMTKFQIDNAVRADTTATLDVSIKNFEGKFKYCNSLTQIAFQFYNSSFKVTIDGNNLPSSLTTIHAPENLGFVGDFEELGKAGNLTALRIFSSGVKGGSLEGFVANARKVRPVNSDGMLLPWCSSIGTGITANGVRITGDYLSGTSKVFWTENTITYDNMQSGDAHKTIVINA